MKEETTNSPLRDIPDLPGGATLSPEVEQRIRAMLANEKAPTRAVVVRHRWLAFAGAIALSVVQLLALGFREDLSSLPLWYTAGWLIAPVALCGVALWLAVLMQARSLGVRVLVASAFCFLLPAALAALALGLPVPHVQPAAHPWSGTLRCFEWTLAGALPPLAFAAVALRRAFATAAAHRGALVGAACGLLSGAVINIHCPMIDPMHLLLGHVFPVMGSVLLGAWVGHRWLRP
jgi:hypothetical protein